MTGFFWFLILLFVYGLIGKMTHTIIMKYCFGGKKEKGNSDQDVGLTTGVIFGPIVFPFVFGWYVGPIIHDTYEYIITQNEKRKAEDK